MAAAGGHLSLLPGHGRRGVGKWLVLSLQMPLRQQLGLESLRGAGDNAVA